jgi:hypothetical protein
LGGGLLLAAPRWTYGADVTVQDVLSMASAGLSEDLIIAKIRRSSRPVNLETDQMIQLKRANLSDAVIKALLDPTSSGTYPGYPPTGSTSGGSIGDPNDPWNPHESGIYLLAKDRDGRSRMVMLERAATQGSRSAGMWGPIVTGGWKKMKMKSVIPGVSASVRTDDPSPAFYFYFEDRAAGLGKGLFGYNLTSPNQFALLRLEVNKSNRETVTMEAGGLGVSTGTDAKAMVGFRAERIRPAAYKVTVNNPLASGEYCFLAGYAGGGAATAIDIFDFGVSAR